MRHFERISRDEFCEKTKVSKRDPHISCVLNGFYFGPALDTSYYKAEDKEDDHSHQYYLKDYRGDWWKFIPLEHSGVSTTAVQKWIPDEMSKYGGKWRHWKNLY